MKTRNKETTNLIVETLEAQITPAKAALAARWMQWAINRQQQIIDTAVNPLVSTSNPSASPNPHSRQNAGRGADVYMRTAWDNDLRSLFDLGDDPDGRRLFRNRPYTAKSEADLRVKADLHASDVWAAFICKMSKKFAKINVDSVTIHGANPLVNMLHCIVGDVAFTLTNSIVTKISPNGLWFNQFPARFGNVTQNGEAVKNSASLKAVEALCNPQPC